MFFFKKKRATNAVVPQFMNFIHPATLEQMATLTFMRGG